ncbi:hypothetical protein [uncultured Clostridium sp.]|uniref:hypothetical protein n=1 Tax=uncultured Clostridium sp. TaxID=59620 RepID=UPI0025847C45|nr:hypothetical protein [uncultured Clostridium sp.]
MNKKLNIKFLIKNECFYNNGKIVLNSLSPLESLIREVLSKSCAVNTVDRNEKNKSRYIGVNANDLNKVLRECISNIPEINNETHIENGFFYHDSKKGFDFSIYDKDYNLKRLYNYYMGINGVLNGGNKIYEINKKLKLNKKEWKLKIKKLSSEAEYNKDIIYEKKKLTVVGELQFGNWALTYRDLFRLINADNNPGVDFYIYITATGKLSDLLSSRTVSYLRVINIISENSSILKTPMWIIGLDIE